MWKPDEFALYAEHRARPFFELVERIPRGYRTTIDDLGCGTGILTHNLAERWPGSRIRGIDSSAAMLERAVAGSGVTFHHGDIATYEPAPSTDLILSAAALQWVPQHRDLLASWAKMIRPGAAIAFHVPGNFHTAAFLAVTEIATQDPFCDVLGTWCARGVQPVSTPDQYAELMLTHGCSHVDAWESTYVHLLPVTGAEHPVVAWMCGTVLGPIRALLDGALWEEYLARLRRVVVEQYPTVCDVVPYSARRVFCVSER